MPRVIAFDIDGTLVDLVPAIHAVTEMRLFTDALPALAMLESRYTLGIGSNGDSHARRCGLGAMFAFEVYARVDGVPPKPNPAFFARLVEAAGMVVPREIVYVGDSVDDDIVPAAAAGLRTVWLNRRAAPAPRGPCCDAVIGSLAELPAALATLDDDRSEDRHNFREVVVSGYR